MGDVAVGSRHRVIDVDAHFLEPYDWWPSAAPDLVGELPPPEPYAVADQASAAVRELGASAVSGPRGLEEAYADLHLDLVEKMLAVYPQHFDPDARDPSYDGAARAAQLDGWGIDVQWINPTFGAFMNRIAISTGRSDLIPRL